MTSQKVIDRARILIVEDSPSLALLYSNVLQANGFNVTIAHTGEEGILQLSQNDYDIVLLDLELPGISGFDVIDALPQSSNPPTIVVITGHGSDSVAEEVKNRGVTDYLEKPVAAPRLSLTISNVNKQRNLASEISELKARYQLERFEGFVGSSQAMQSVYALIKNAAPSRAPIFIIGDSGTGKELCAEAVHTQSKRHDKPFVVLNCAAVPRELMESEIFGHIKGAFTGAMGDRAGAAERANNGTLFLDEICELPLDLQSKLLRFLQTGAIQKVGGSQEIRLDVRIVCATNRDPWAEVQQGNFREDLYYRLHVIEVKLPALKDREGDVLVLADHFLKNISHEEGKSFHSFDPVIRRWIQTHTWPGNVRELQNWVRSIVVLNTGPVVDISMLPMRYTAQNPNRSSRDRCVNTPQGEQDKPSLQPLWVEEKTIIERAIRLCGGNVQRAAAALEISPSTIYRKKLQWEKHLLGTIDATQNGLSSN